MGINNFSSSKGFTLVEVTIILLVLVILSSILLPNLGGFNRLARYARVKEDVGAICASAARMLVDIGEVAFYHWGGRDSGRRDSDTPYRYDPVGLLIGDGDIPELNGNLGSTGTHWQAPYREKFAEGLDISGIGIEFRVDTIANHMIHNTPSGNAANAYRTPLDMISGNYSAGIYGGLHFDPAGGQGFNSLFAWRGPYLSDRVDADPWGNRYMINVFALWVPTELDSDGFSSAVVCYSAGPDEEIDTAFNQPVGWTTGDDDFTAIVHSGGSR
jgi:type II secretory pathway pseudopilin PulG